MIVPVLQTMSGVWNSQENLIGYKTRAGTHVQAFVFFLITKVKRA